MSENKIHDYFKRKSVEWEISDFLRECNEGSFKKKINVYIKSLENIASFNKGKQGEKKHKPSLTGTRRQVKNHFC